MHLFYVDESFAEAKGKKFFILAGFSVFERQARHLTKKLDAIASRFNPDKPRHVELHGNPMYKGRGFWRRMERQERVLAICDSLQALANTPGNVRVFVSVVDTSEFEGKLYIEAAFAQIADLFDSFLAGKDKGLMLFDKTPSFEERLQTLAAEYREASQKSAKKLRNFLEVPMFVNSKTSRLIQLADIVAYSANIKIRGDDSFYNIIAGKV